MEKKANHRELIIYLFFGVLTTGINYVTYLLVAPLFSSVVVPTMLAWAVSVLFAYVTNRQFVFLSKKRGAKAIFGEALSFFAARLLSGVLDVALMWILVDLLGWMDWLMKLLSNIVVIILNYAVSKWIVFQEKKA